MRKERLIAALFIIVGTAMIGEGAGRAIFVPFLSQVAGNNAIILLLVGLFASSFLGDRIGIRSTMYLSGLFYFLAGVVAFILLLSFHSDALHEREPT